MKKDDLEDRIEELSDEQEKKDKAPKEEDDVKAEKAINSLDKMAEKDVEWSYIQKEASEAAPQFLKIHPSGKKIKPKDAAGEFDKQAESYLMALGYKAPKGNREFYGHMMRTWLGGHRQDGGKTGDVEDAIKKGDQATVLYLFQQAYQSNVYQAKTQSQIHKIQTMDTGIREKAYIKLADKLGMEDKEDHTKLIKISESLPQAYNTLKNKKAVLDDYRMAA